MLILGLNKTTLLDYPEHVAATIFTGGCNRAAHSAITEISYLPVKV